MPELAVSALPESLAFWCGLLGFTVAYDRPAARFAFLVWGGVQILVQNPDGYLLRFAEDLGARSLSGDW